MLEESTVDDISSFNTSASSIGRKRSSDETGNEGVPTVRHFLLKAIILLYLGVFNYAN